MEVMILRLYHKNGSMSHDKQYYMQSHFSNKQKFKSLKKGRGGKRERKQFEVFKTFEKILIYISHTPIKILERFGYCK